MQTIRVGVRVSLPGATSVAGATETTTAVVGAAAAFDELGVDVLFVDHGTVAAGALAIDPDVLLGYVARRTRRLGLAVGATLGGGRAPSVLAKSVTSLDLCSHGRAVVAVRPAPAVDALERSGRFSEGCTVLRMVLDGNSAAWHGRYVSVDGAWNEPRVVHDGRVPIVVDVGSGTDDAVVAPAGSADYVVVTPPGDADLADLLGRAAGAGDHTSLPALAALDVRLTGNLLGAAQRCRDVGFTGVVVDALARDLVALSTRAEELAAVVAMFAAG